MAGAATVQVTENAWLVIRLVFTEDPDLKSSPLTRQRRNTGFLKSIICAHGHEQECKEGFVMAGDVSRTITVRMAAVIALTPFHRQWRNPRREGACRDLGLERIVG